MMRHMRVHAGLLGLVGGSLILTGCMGPTYGTSKSSGEQLLDDIGNAVMIQTPGADEAITGLPTEAFAAVGSRCDEDRAIHAAGRGEAA